MFLFCFSGNDKPSTLTVNNDTEYSRLGKQSVVFTNGDNSTLLKFPSIHGQFNTRVSYPYSFAGMSDLAISQTSYSLGLNIFYVL